MEEAEISVYEGLISTVSTESFQRRKKRLLPDVELKVVGNTDLEN